MSSFLPDPSSPKERQKALRRMLEKIDFEPLYEVWRSAEGGIADHLETGILSVLYEVCSEQALRRGEVFMAKELANRGQRLSAEAAFDETLCFQLQARALARSGAVRPAVEILMRLAKVTEDAESKGLLAGRYRDFAFEETDSEKRRKLFKEALFHARNSFKEHPESYYNGIQAAQFAFFTGETEEMNQHLRRVEELCHQKELRAFSPNSQEPYWLNVTLAEAALIRGEIEKADRRYKAMVDEEERWPSDTEATRKVAFALIAHHGGGDRFDPIRTTLKRRPVVVFSGHLFDCEREQLRLPVSWRKLVSRAMDRVFAELRPLSVYCSLSLGADLLFAEAAVRYFRDEAERRRRLSLERKRDSVAGPPPVHLVVAFDLDKTHADFEAMAEKMAREKGLSNPARYARRWTRRLRTLLASVPRSRIHEVDYPANGVVSEAYAYTNDLMTGMAYLRARETGSEVVPVVVHDGNAGELGGAGNFVTSLRDEARARTINLYEEAKTGA
jgi:hypothetical protein